MFVYCVCAEGGGVVAVYSSYDGALNKVKEEETSGTRGCWVEEKRVLGGGSKCNPLDETLDDAGSLAAAAAAASAVSVHVPERSQSGASAVSACSGVSSLSGRVLPARVCEALARNPTWPAQDLLAQPCGGSARAAFDSDGGGSRRRGSASGVSASSAYSAARTPWWGTDGDDSSSIQRFQQPFVP